MGRGSGSIRPHLSVLLSLIGVLAGLLLHTSVLSVPMPLPQGEVGERIAAALSAELSLLRRVFVESGAALVGRVGYSWGSKSDVVRWDARWGVPVVVTVPGGSNSGESLPFGLDCSGFVPWCTANVAGDPATFAVMGNGVRAQRALHVPVSRADAPPGDLAFYPDLSYVGIVASRGEDGGLLAFHCSYSLRGMVYSSDARAAGLIDPGRPSLFEKTPWFHERTDEPPQFQ